MTDALCICGDEPDPWCGVHPFTITTTPARRNEPRPADDPGPRCPDGHDNAGGRCWTPGCENGGAPVGHVEEGLERYTT